MRKALFWILEYRMDFSNNWKKQTALFSNILIYIYMHICIYICIYIYTYIYIYINYIWAIFKGIFSDQTAVEDITFGYLSNWSCCDVCFCYLDKPVVTPNENPYPWIGVTVGRAGHLYKGFEGVRMSIFSMLEWSNSTRKRVQWPSFFGVQDIEYPKCSMYWVCSPTFTPKNRANLGNCMELSLPYPIWFKWIQVITALIHINPYKSQKTHWKLKHEPQRILNTAQLKHPWKGRWPVHQLPSASRRYRCHTLVFFSTWRWYVFFTWRTWYGILTNNSVYKLIVGVYQNIVIIIIYIHEYTMGSLYKPLTLLLHGAGIDTKICPKITQFCRFLYTSTMEHMGHLHTFTSFTVFRGTKID